DAVQLRGRLLLVTGHAGAHPLRTVREQPGVLVQGAVTAAAGRLARMGGMRERDLLLLAAIVRPVDLAFFILEPGNFLLGGLVLLLVQVLVAVHAERLGRHSRLRLFLRALVTVDAGDPADRVGLVVEGTALRRRRGKDRLEDAAGVPDDGQTRGQRDHDDREPRIAP